MKHSDSDYDETLFGVFMEAEALAPAAGFDLLLTAWSGDGRSGEVAIKLPDVPPVRWPHLEIGPADADAGPQALIDRCLDRLSRRA